MKTFMHYRKYDRMGQIQSRGGLTLAIRCEGQTITVALARCSRHDNFNKKLGRKIAEGRLNSNSGTHTLNLPEQTLVKSFVHDQDFVRKEVKKLLAGGR